MSPVGTHPVACAQLARQELMYVTPFEHFTGATMSGQMQ
jgi:hypothetical protein